jgi:hypothetical protein
VTFQLIPRFFSFLALTGCAGAAGVTGVAGATGATEAAGVTGAAATAAAGKAVPHSVQNFAPSGRRLPHWIQNIESPPFYFTCFIIEQLTEKVNSYSLFIFIDFPLSVCYNAEVA